MTATDCVVLEYDGDKYFLPGREACKIINPEIKARWVAALRSGDHKQSKHALRTENGYCCLGVLTHLLVDELGLDVRVGLDVRAGGEQPFRGDKAYSYNGSVSLPPLAVAAQLYGEVVHSPASVIWAVPGPGDSLVSLAQLNDNGFSFAEIADLIEKHL